MTPSELCREAARRGLRLESRGDKLAVIPAKLCPPEFADLLRKHKGELLDWLHASADGLAPDCAPWLHVAKQVLAGEFDGADGSTVASIRIGLQGIPHLLCRSATGRLRLTSPKPSRLK